MNKHIITLEQVSKTFILEHKKEKLALEHTLGLLRSRKKTKIQALDRVSCTIKNGQTYGIIGANGSGKSTLLRIMAGIYTQNAGRVKVPRKITYLSGFSVGLNEGLTMRENIFLSGSLLGLTRKEIQHLIPQIITFSELEDYIDVKISKFSSGMLARLSFAITFYSLSTEHPGVLLLDEVLTGAGDESFQRKTKDAITKLIRSEATVVLVSHNLEQIKEYCDSVLWLDHGRVAMQGETHTVIKAYEASVA